MAEVTILDPNNPKVEFLRYSPMGVVTDGTLTMEPKFARSLLMCMQVVAQAKHSQNIPVSSEAEEFMLFLHSIISDAETHGFKMELRTIRPGGEGK